MGLGSGVVTGRGPVLSEPGDVLDAGNSGTSMRLLAGGFGGAAVFFGAYRGCVAAVAGRWGGWLAPLRRMGATALGRQGGELAPLAIRGGDLRGIEYDLPVASAQVKSCILLAGLAASGEYGGASAGVVAGSYGADGDGDGGVGGVGRAGFAAASGAVDGD